MALSAITGRHYTPGAARTAPRLPSAPFDSMIAGERTGRTNLTLEDSPSDERRTDPDRGRRGHDEHQGRRLRRERPRPEERELTYPHPLPGTGQGQPRFRGAVGLFRGHPAAGHRRGPGPRAPGGRNT